VSGKKRNFVDIALKAWVLLGFVFISFPLFLVAWLSLFTDPLLALPPSGYSFHWYSRIFVEPQFFNGFLLSLEVALIAMVVGLAVSIPAALVLARAEFWGKQFLMYLLTSPLIVPSIVIGASLYVSFIQLEYLFDWSVIGSTLGLGAAHILITIPWCVRLIVANLLGVDLSVEEASRSLGATPFVTLYKVTIPLIWPGIVAAALFSFVISFGNLELSLFLVAPGQITLPIAILQYLEYKIDPTIAAVSVLQILIIGGGLLITNKFVPLARVVK
jgi:putative spermidine/putrescine transport system permease protein